MYKKMQEEIDHYDFKYFLATFILSIAEHAECGRNLCRTQFFSFFFWLHHVMWFDSGSNLLERETRDREQWQVEEVTDTWSLEHAWPLLGDHRRRKQGKSLSKLGHIDLIPAAEKVWSPGRHQTSASWSGTLVWHQTSASSAQSISPTGLPCCAI